MALFRRKKVRREHAVYVHLALDGGIFVIRGQTGEQLWTDRGGLVSEIERVRDLPGAVLLYSREGANTEPPPHVLKTFELLVAATEEKMPVQLLDEPHPEAMRQPHERQTILHDD